MTKASIQPVAIIIVHPGHQTVSINSDLIRALKKANINHLALLPLQFDFLKARETPRVIREVDSLIKDLEAKSTLGPMGDILEGSALYFMAELKTLKNKSQELTQSGFIVEDLGIGSIPRPWTPLFASKLSTEPDALFMEKLTARINKNPNDRYIIFNLHTESVNIPPLPNVEIIPVSKDDTERKILDAMKSFQLRITCENYLAHLNEPQTENEQKLTDQTLTQEKIAIVQQLIALTIKPDSLTEFERLFKSKRQIIEARRDTQTMVFLKIVLSFFTFGLAPLFGLWKIEGEQVTSDLELALAPSPN